MNTEQTLCKFGYMTMASNKFKSLKSNCLSNPMNKKLSETEVSLSRLYQNLNYYITLLFISFNNYEWSRENVALALLSDKYIFNNKYIAPLSGELIYSKYHWEQAILHSGKSIEFEASKYVFKP